MAGILTYAWPRLSAPRRRSGPPQAVAGQPWFPPQQQPQMAAWAGQGGQGITGPTVSAPGSATLYEDATGRPLARMGDNPSVPEMVSVQPVGGVMARPKTQQGSASTPVSMASGGDVLLGSDPSQFAFNQNAYQAADGNWYAPNTPATLTGTPGVAMASSTGASTPSGPAQNIQNQQLAYYGAANTALDARAGVTSAQMATIPYQQNVINAQGQLIGANGQVLDQRGVANQANIAYIGQQQQDTQQTIQEQQGINAAAANIGDKTAVARYRDFLNNTDPLYGLAGMAVPTEVATNGEPFQDTPGVRAAPQTQEEILSNKAQAAQKLRALQLDAAREIVALASTDVEKAQIQAARVGLTVDEARRQVSQADLTVQTAQGHASFADINAQRASLAVDKAKLPPVAGEQLYTDPDTLESRWVSPAELARLDSQNKRSQALMQPATVLAYNPATKRNEYVTPDVALAYERAVNASVPPAAQRYSNTNTALASVPTDTILNLLSKAAGYDWASVFAELSARMGPDAANARMNEELASRAKTGFVPTVPQ